MEYKLPEQIKNAIDFPHFPTKHQAFIFRAYEFVSAKKIAQILGTTEENVKKSAKDMGLPEFNPGSKWLTKGYITIIRRLWHILPYEQLLQLLDMDEQELAVILREEDFLDVKLFEKPICAPVKWRELTKAEKSLTEEIKKIVEKIDFSGVEPFDFKYDVPEISFSGKENFETRMMYLFTGLYQHAFDVDSEEYCSDEILEAYQKLGVNVLWTQGVLSQLTEFPFEPSISKGYTERLERMKKFIKRLKKYGIKLYLYINEPRYMPASFFEKYPNLRGHQQENGDTCLCTSTPEVQNYLKDGVEKICKAVPELGGFFTITRSENLTNCYSHSTPETCLCPRCKDKSVGEIIGKTVSCILEGARRVSKDIKVFAWSWGWKEYCEDIINNLPKEVILLSQSELDVPFNIGGITGNVLDYSMSIIGPGEKAKTEWEIAKKRGLEVGAKVKICTSWEASTVPALPVIPLVEEHIERLKKHNVQHLMLSWTLGGYPCANVAHVAKHFFENCTLEPTDSTLYEAEKVFSNAFKEFPFHVSVLYNGPQNAGPSNLLFEKPTGYNSSMTCFAYDDLESWRSIYPVDIFEDQFKKLCEGWENGLDILKDYPECETTIMAHAAYCLFKSSLNQIRFIRARNENRLNDALCAAKEELIISEKMLNLMNKNAAIGFEAANHYYFSKGQLAEKIINCHYIIKKFSK